MNGQKTVWKRIDIISEDKRNRKLFKGYRSSSYCVETGVRSESGFALALSGWLAG
jgi:hypothetical protein